MAILCVHIPAFGLALARRDEPGIPAAEPAALADKRDRGRIIAVDAAAHALGARIGQTVLQARAAVGGVHVFVHDAHRSHAVWSDMLDALDAISPIVDDSGEGTAYLDMRGIGGDARTWCTRALHVLCGFELPVRAAVGPNKFTARARTYSVGDDISGLSIDVLDIDARALERLRLLGIRTLGELAQLPHGPFVRRFGKQAAAWHHCAQGIDSTPLRPRAHELHIDAAAFGEGNAEAEEQVLFALRVLADRVCNDLERAGKAAGKVHLLFECENGDVREIESGFAQPTGDARVMLDVVRAKLEGLTFDAPITGLRMQALQLEECGAPATLFGQNGADPQALAVALARLQALTGAAPQRARTRPSALLEGRFWYEEFPSMPQGGSIPHHDNAPSPQHDKHVVPQLKLLAVKEIDVRMRGNAPQRVQHKRVLSCAGPWRLDDGWFADAPVARDEFDVLLEDGMLCRIYRQGERWYLRGSYD
jgi:protein ImuB